MSLVIFCLLFSFADYVPVKGESIWYLSLTTWLISLSIMLSSSIHAVTKGMGELGRDSVEGRQGRFSNDGDVAQSHPTNS